MTRIGRNAPCRCGSGKKHGRCCWTEHPLIAMDRELTQRVLAWVINTRGVGWLADACAAWRGRFADIEALGDWLWTCLLHHHEPGLFEEFLLDAEGLTLPQLALARARHRGLTSIYAVEGARPGKALVIQDMLDPLVRVTLQNAWPNLRRNSVLLGRIVNVDGAWLLLSMHPQALGRVFGLTACHLAEPLDATQLTVRWQEVVNRLDFLVRLGGTGAVPSESLLL